MKGKDARELVVGVEENDGEKRAYSVTVRKLKATHAAWLRTEKKGLES